MEATVPALSIVGIAVRGTSRRVVGCNSPSIRPAYLYTRQPSNRCILTPQVTHGSYLESWLRRGSGGMMFVEHSFTIAVLAEQEYAHARLSHVSMTLYLVELRTCQVQWR